MSREAAEQLIEALCVNLICGLVNFVRVIDEDLSPIPKKPSMLDIPTKVRNRARWLVAGYPASDC
ncbi:MAG: hypothetical protein GY788_14685 [bacterium]|nr:hypothetical protein [bacterium]